MSKALKVVPKPLKFQPLFLSIDDTLVEKKGEKFELRSKLFDHAVHNGSNYLNGHCMVSILLSFPVMTDSRKIPTKDLENANAISDYCLRIPYMKNRNFI